MQSARSTDTLESASNKLGGTKIGTIISFMPVITMTGCIISIAVDAAYLGFFHAHTIVLLTLTILTSMYSIVMAFENPPKGQRLFLQRLVVSLFPFMTASLLACGAVCTFLDDPLIECRPNFAPVFPALAVYMFEGTMFALVSHLSIRRASMYVYKRFRAKAVVGLLSRFIIYVLTLSTLDIIRDLYSDGIEVTLTASTWATSCATITTAFAIGQVMLYGDFDMMMLPKRRIWAVDAVMIFVTTAHMIMTGLTYGAELFGEPQFLNNYYLIGATALNDFVFSFCISYHRYKATKIGLELGLVEHRTGFECSLTTIELEMPPGIINSQSKLSV